MCWFENYDYDSACRPTYIILHSERRPWCLVPDTVLVTRVQVGIPIAFIYFEGETWELPQITKTVNEMVGFGYDGGLYPHWIIQYWAIHQYLL